MRYIILSMLLSGVALSSCGNKKTKNSAFADQTISVKTVQLKPARTERSITVTGLIGTQTEVRYAFKTGGIIDRIFVSEGRSFRKGQLLARLKLNEIDAGVIQARLGLAKAERDLQRAGNLYQDSVATLEQVQNARTSADLARKQLEALAFNRKYALIYAAEAGFVSRKLANEGEVVASGYPVLAINENKGNKAWVLKAGVSDKDWAAVNVGNKALVTIDAFPQTKLAAVVSKRVQAADQTSGTFLIELKLLDASVRPAVGMYAKAVIQTGVPYEEISLPYEALIEADGDQAFVFVPVGLNKVRKQLVRIGSFNNQEVRISAGLEGIKEVLIGNSAFLNERSTIHIVN